MVALKCNAERCFSCKPSSMQSNGGALNEYENPESERIGRIEPDTYAWCISGLNLLCTSGLALFVGMVELSLLLLFSLHAMLTSP